MDAYNLKATLTLDSSQYEEALEKVRTQSLPEYENECENASNTTNALASTFKIVGGTIGAVVGAVGSVSTAFVKMTDDFASYGDNIDKMSQKMGMSATAYQEWDAVMQHSGTSMETLKASMKTLANAAQSNSEAFTKLGISQEQIAKMSQEELFSATITALQNVEDETERTYLAGKTLGRGATELGALLNTSAEETQAMKDRVHELGGVMSDEAVKAAAKYKDTLQDMTTAFNGLKRNLVNEFLPSVTTVMDGLTELFAGNDEKGLDIINKGIGDFAENLSATIPKALNIATSIVTSIGDALTENAPVILDAGANIIVQLAEGAVQRLPMLVSTGVGAITTLAESIAKNTDKIIPAINQAIVEIVDIITNPDTTLALIDAGANILVALADGMIDAIDKLDEKFPVILDNIFTIVEKGGEKLLETGALILHKIVDGILGEDNFLSEALGDIVDVIDEGILPAFKGVLDFLKGDWLLGIAEVGDGFTGVFSNALGVIDSLFGTSLEQWYNDLKTWADDTSKEIIDSFYEAQRIINQVTYDASDMRTDIMYAFNRNVREGQDALEAFENAKNEYVKSAEDLVIYNENLATEFTVENIIEHALQVQRDGISRTQEEIDKANQQIAAYYEAAYGNWKPGGLATVKEELDDVTAEMEETATKSGKKIKEALTFETKNVGEYKNLGAVEVLGRELTEAEEKSNKIADKVFTASRTYIEHQTAQLDLSLQEQIELWQKVQGQFISGSEQFLKAGDKIAQLQKQQNQKTTEAEKKALKEKTELLKKWETESAKIYENIQSIQDKYTKSLDETTNKIYTSFDIFEKVPERVQVSGEDLINNLTEQNARLTKFYASIETLSARGVSERVVEELRAKGVGALDQVDALLDLADDRLAAWNEQAELKFDISSEEAAKQLEPLKEETDKQIAEQFSDLEALEKETGQNIGATFAEGISEGILGGVSGMINAAKAGVAAMKSAFVGNLSYNVDTAVAQTPTTKTAQTAAKALGTASGALQTVVNINGIQYQNFTELVKAVSEELQTQMERSAAYAGT